MTPPLLVCCSYCDTDTPAVDQDRWGTPRCPQHTITYPPAKKRRG